MRDRVRPPKELEGILDRLKDEDKVFETKQKGLMFAAAVGFALHRDEVDTVDIEHYGEGIRLDYFRPQDEGFIDALAVAKAEDLNVLDPEKQADRVELFERCAKLGLEDIKRYCYDERPADSVLGILALIDLMERPSEDDLPGLDAAVKQLDQFL